MEPKMSRIRLLTTRLEPAIRSKSCPICLRHVSDRRAAVLTSCLHAYCVGCIERWSGVKRSCPLCNASFDGWFFRIDSLSGTFLRHRLMPNEDERERGGRRERGRRPLAMHRTFIQHRLMSNEDERKRGCRRERVRSPLALLRVVRRSREEFNCSNQRSRPLPRRRWFGNPGPVSSDAVPQRILQWRLSIYEQRLQAVPHFCRSNLLSNTTGNNMVKERILKRIEPWIRRELKATLGDPDPSIIVHVASSLYISSLESLPNQSFLEDNYLEPLRPFLHELTDMFWHELRCFAASLFNMETYDSVTEYRKMIE